MRRQITCIDEPLPSDLDFSGPVASLITSYEVLRESPSLDEVIRLVTKFGMTALSRRPIKLRPEITQPFAQGCRARRDRQFSLLSLTDRQTALNRSS